MTCILIDDEADCLELLALMIHKYCPELTIVGQYSSPRLAIEAVWEKRPDLVFLDVDMPEINGFGVLDACREVPFQVIFTTAYQEYAVKAFKYSATGYLLKPIDRLELADAVQRARRQLSVQQLAEQRDILLSYMHPNHPNRERIALPTSEGIVFLSVADIEYCEAEGSYSNIWTSGQQKPTLFVKSLKDLEEMLPGDVFFRAHHSFLINLKKVRQYIKGNGGELKMFNGEIVPVARPKKQALLERLANL